MAVVAICAALLIVAATAALVFFGHAAVAAMAPILGEPGAAVLIGAILLVVASACALVIRRRIQDAKRMSMVAGLAGTGAANMLMGFAFRRPLLTAGLGGLAYMLVSNRSKSK